MPRIRPGSRWPLFDAGYVVEALSEIEQFGNHMKQLAGSERVLAGLTHSLEARPLLEKSAALRPGDASIEFALGLMSRAPETEAHLQQGARAARAGRAAGEQPGEASAAVASRAQDRAGQRRTGGGRSGRWPVLFAVIDSRPVTSLPWWSSANFIGISDEYDFHRVVADTEGLGNTDADDLVWSAMARDGVRFVRPPSGTARGVRHRTHHVGAAAGSRTRWRSSRRLRD